VLTPEEVSARQMGSMRSHRIHMAYFTGTLTLLKDFGLKESVILKPTRA